MLQFCTWYFSHIKVYRHRNHSRTWTSILLAWCPLGHSIQHTYHLVGEYLTIWLLNFQVLHIPLGINNKTHHYPTFQLACLCTARVNNVFRQPFHECRWATRKFRKLFHYMEALRKIFCIRVIKNQRLSLLNLCFSSLAFTLTDKQFCRGSLCLLLDNYSLGRFHFSYLWRIVCLSDSGNHIIVTL